MNRTLIQKLRKKEKWLLIISSSFAILIISFAVIMLITSIVFKGYKSKIYFGDKDFTKGQHCDTIYNINVIFSDFLFVLGCFAALSKLMIGGFGPCSLLGVMKKKLRYFYYKIKKYVICTVIVTLVIIVFNGVINYIDTVDYSLFWRYTFIKLRGIILPKMIWEAVGSFFNVGLEVFLMCFSMQNVDYYSYLYSLLYGGDNLPLLSDMSIFLVKRKNIPDKTTIFDTTFPTTSKHNDESSSYLLEKCESKSFEDTNYKCRFLAIENKSPSRITEKKLKASESSPFNSGNPGDDPSTHITGRDTTQNQILSAAGTSVRQSVRSKRESLSFASRGVYAKGTDE